MSVWGKRESYSMVAFTVSFWVALSFLAWLFFPLIPSEEKNLVKDPDSFRAIGQRQNIRWREWGESAIGESRRRDVPILLVIGTGFSELGKSTDILFGISEVAETVSQNTVPVRIDLERNPGWRNRYLPLTRGVRGDLGWFQIHVLDYDGNLVSSPADKEVWSWNDAKMISWLNQVRRTYLDRGLRELQKEQVKQEEILTGAVDSGIPEVEPYVQRILTKLRYDLQNQAVAENTYLDPQSLSLLLKAGYRDDVELEVKRLVRTLAVDWLNGEFFFFSKSSDWKKPVYTKVRCLSVDMLEPLATVATDRESLEFEFLRLSFDKIVSELEKDNFYTYSTTEQNDAGRSLSYSFSPNRLRANFPPRSTDLSEREKEFALNVLGLDVTINPQMSPFVRNSERFFNEGELRERVFGKLRQLSRSGSISTYGAPLITKKAYVISRLLSVSGKLGSKESERVLKIAEDFRNEVRVGLNDVYGWKIEEQYEPGSLESYLSYSSLCLSAFELTGDISWREDAAIVFKRGLFLFGHDEGQIVSDLDSLSIGSWAPRISDFMDGDTASLLGQAVSVCAKLESTARTQLEREYWLDRSREMVKSMGEAFRILPRGISGLAKAIIEIEDAAELTY